VAAARDVVSMSEDGISGVFVNTHGFVHDMTCVRRARNCALSGRPEVENRWLEREHPIP
jgi:hypothetical protein